MSGSLYPEDMDGELAQIADRIDARRVADRADRARQRELIRQAIRVDGRTWNDVQGEARVSRPTLRRALRD